MEFKVVKQPGFYGWPYCVRDNVPYNDYDFATGTSGRQFDCAAPVNNSPNNTGIPTSRRRSRPPCGWATPRPTRAFPGLGTGGAPTGGPRYDFDPDLTSPTQVPGVLRRALVHRRVEQRLDQDGHAGRPTATPPASSGRRGRTPFVRPHEIEFGPDGSLYVIDWGTGFSGNNLDSGIYRIDYVAG